MIMEESNRVGLLKSSLQHYELLPSSDPIFGFAALSALQMARRVTQKKVAKGQRKNRVGLVLSSTTNALVHYTLHL